MTLSALPIQGANGSTLSYDDFEHLKPFEWEALRRLASMAGITTVCAMLKDTPERLQCIAIQDFVNCELAELRRQASTPAVATGSSVVKLDVSSYSSEGLKRRALNRWLCEVDIFFIICCPSPPTHVGVFAHPLPPIQTVG